MRHFGKNDTHSPGISVAQSERKKSPRSSIPMPSRREPARPVRVRRDPRISRGENRQLVPHGAALGDHRVGRFPDGRYRAVFARSASSTNSPASTPRTSGRATATSTNLEAPLGVIETRLAGEGKPRQWIMTHDFTIADVSMIGWVRSLVGFYGAGELVAYDTSTCPPAWLERALARPAVLDIPKRAG